MFERFKRMSSNQLGIEIKIQNTPDELESRLVMPFPPNGRFSSPHDIGILHIMVSSPRMFDVYLKNLDRENYQEVGDTFLSRNTSLADFTQPTVGISMEQWQKIKLKYEQVESFNPNDTTITRVQIWSFDPKTISESHLQIAIAVSYAVYELDCDPRLAGAINETISWLGIAYNF